MPGNNSREIPKKYCLTVGTTDFLTSAELNKSIFMNFLETSIFSYFHHALS